MNYFLTLYGQALVESKRQFHAKNTVMVNINAFIAALKATLLRKIITDNNSPWSIILQFMADTKIVFNLKTHFITEKILPKIKKKQVLERCILISYTNTYKNTPQIEIQQFQFSPMKTSK